MLPCLLPTYGAVKRQGNQALLAVYLLKVGYSGAGGFKKDIFYEHI